MFRLTRVLLIAGCTLLPLLILLSSSSLALAQKEENLNFCEITCVINIYKKFCGEAKCTTGASDYPQRYALCSETCTSAIIGDVMSYCLTESNPERDDWDGVQSSTLQEIVSYCSGYDIPLIFDIKPQKLKDVDKSFLKTMFGTSGEETEKTKGRRKRNPRSKGKKSRKAKAGKKDSVDTVEEEEQVEEAETQVEEDTKEESKTTETPTVIKSSKSESTVSKSATSGETKKRRTSKTKASRTKATKTKATKTKALKTKATKTSSSTSSSIEQEEQDEEEGLVENRKRPKKDVGVEDAPGSEASEPMEDGESIEENLEKSVEDSQPSKTG